MPSTLQASTRIDGLAPGAIVMFNYRSITKKGVGDWIPAITATASSGTSKGAT